MFKNIEEIKNKYNLRSGSDWLNLKQGSNKVRIVSEFVDFGVHSVKEKGKFRSVVCIGKDKCPYCQQGIPVRVQFLGWVIDRTDGEVKLLKIGWTIFDKLVKLAQSPDYHFDDLPPYDIDIVKTGEGLDTEYAVIPARQDTPLTEKEKEKIKEKVKNPQEIIDRMKEKASDNIVEAIDIDFLE